MDNKILHKIIFDTTIKLSNDIIDRLNIILALNTNMDDNSIVKDIIPSKNNFICSIQKIIINDLIIIFDSLNSQNYNITVKTCEYDSIIDQNGNKYFSDINGIHKYIDVQKNILFIDKNNILTSKYKNIDFSLFNYKFTVNLDNFININQFYSNSSTLKFLKEIKNFIEIGIKKGIIVLDNQKILFYKPDIYKSSTFSKTLIMYIDFSLFFDISKNNIIIKNLWQNSDTLFNTIKYLDEISKIITQFENLKNILVQYKNIYF